MKTAKMTFTDNSEIEIMSDGHVKIINNGEELEFNEVDKPVFKNETGERVIEYSGLATDHNQGRSWAIAHFEPKGSSVAHYHKIGVEDYYITSENADAHITIDGNEHILTTGDHLRILPGQVHKVSNGSEDTALSLIVKCAPSWVFSDQYLPESDTGNDNTLGGLTPNFEGL
jgi:mannose-6-phosphate isomerase-like protein (cupin superfamily)